MRQKWGEPEAEVRPVEIVRTQPRVTWQVDENTEIRRQGDDIAVVRTGSWGEGDVFMSMDLDGCRRTIRHLQAALDWVDEGSDE